MDIYTSTIRYKEKDRFDITVASATGLAKVFAPTWDMVWGVKKGTISEDQYTSMYLSIIKKTPIEEVKLIIGQHTRFGTITLCCFCPPGDFCHRVLLAKYLEENNIGVYIGERGNTTHLFRKGEV